MLQSKKLVALILAVTVSLTMLPIGVYADETPLIGGTTGESSASEVGISEGESAATGESGIIGDSATIGESDMPIGGSDIDYSIIDSDGSTTVNGDYVLVVNHSNTTSQSTGSLKPLQPYQSSGEIETGGELPELYRVDYHPELGEEIDEPSIGGELNENYILNQNKVFRVNIDLNASGYTYNDFNAKAIYIGTHCVVWVHNGAADSFNKQSNNISYANAKAIGDEFDSRYAAMVENFGTFYNADGSGKVSLLVYDLPDGFSGSGGYIGGYFFAGDLVSIYSNSTGNKMPMLHVDTYPSMGSYPNFDPSGAFSTLVHEFQHLINYSYGYATSRSSYSSNTYINEMLSMAAEEMLYQSEKPSRLYVYNTGSYASSIANGHSLTVWNNANSLPNYSLSFLFGQYLMAQTGSYRIFSDIVKSTYTDERAITNSLSSGNSPLKGMSFENIHMNFRTAVALNESSGLSSFAGSSITTSDYISKNLYPLTGETATIPAGGAILLKNAANGSSTLSFSGKGADVKYYGIKAGIAATNSAPVAKDITAATGKNLTLTGTVTATDADGDALTFSKVANPSHGSATVNANGSFTYTPATGYTGSDSFTFRAYDGKAYSNNATVTISISANNPPVAKNFSVTVQKGQQTLIMPDATDAEGDALAFFVEEYPTCGYVSTVNGLLFYTPKADNPGADSFTYKAYDGKAYSNTAAVSITVQDYPVGLIVSNFSDGVSIDGFSAPSDFGGHLSIPATIGGKNVLKIGTDAFKGCAALTSVKLPGSVTAVARGAFLGCVNLAAVLIPNSVTSIADNVFEGLANGSIYCTSGSYAETYASNHGLPYFLTGSENTAPVVSDLRITIQQNSVALIRLTGFDAENNSLSFTKTAALNGNNSNSFNGMTIYIPNLGFTGTDTFRFYANDRIVNSNTATVTIVVRSPGANKKPVASSGSKTTFINTPLSDQVTATDADNDPLTYSVVAEPKNGSLNIQPDGRYTYIPNSGYTGTDIFSFKANDGLADSDAAKVSITVTPVPVTGVTLSETALTLSTPTTVEGIVPKHETSAALTATVSTVNEQDSGIGVKWTSSNSAVAMVNQNGEITPKGPGTADIAATANGTDANNQVVTRKCTVTVTQTATGVSIANITMDRSGTKMAKASITPANATYKAGVWETLNPEIATINSVSGEITPIKGGEATIRFTTEEGATGTGTVKVTITVTAVRIIGAPVPGESPVRKGDTFQLSAVVEPEDEADQSVIWSSNPSHIASVDATGKVTALSSGNVRITATSKGKNAGNSSVSAYVIMNVISDVTGITLNSKSETLNPGKIFTLVPAVTPGDASNKTIKWVITDTDGSVLDDAKDTLTVDANGKVTAVGKSDIKRVIVWAVAESNPAIRAGCVFTIDVPVAGVKINGDGVVNKKVTLALGASLTLTAELMPAQASGRATWSSSNVKIATVSAEGIVYPVAKGTATISAVSSNGKKDSVTVTVVERVTGVELSSYDITLAKGKNVSLTATILPAAASNKKLKWFIAEGAHYADITLSNGKITAKSSAWIEGDSYIEVIAQSEDNPEIQAVCRVSLTEAQNAIQKLEIDSRSATLYVNSEDCNTTVFTLKANGEDGPGSSNPVWTSSKPSVATVDEAGTVTAVGRGTATITAAAMDGSGKKVTATVTVKKQVETILLGAEEIAVARGKVVPINPVITPADADLKTLEWDNLGNSNIKFANGKITVSKNAEVGEYPLIARAKDGSDVTAEILVMVTSAPSNIVIEGPDDISVGTSMAYTATVVGREDDGSTVGQAVTWSSSNSRIASVDKVSGVVTAIAKGTVTITATTADGSSFKRGKMINIIVPVTSFKLNKEVLVLKKNQSETLKIVTTPANANIGKIVWSIDNQEYFKFDNKGRATALSEDGFAIITAFTMDGEWEAECEVTVVPVRVKSVKLNQASHDFVAQDASFEGIEPLSLWATITSDKNQYEATNSDLMWSSSNEQVAMVEGGEVTPTGFGSARITVTTVDGYKTAACNVNVYPIAKAEKLSVVGAIRTLELTSVPGGKITDKLEVRNQYGTVIPESLLTYSSSKKNIATVDEFGVVTAAAGGSAGSTVITAALNGDPAKRKVTFTVNVVPQQVQRVDIIHRMPSPDGTGMIEQKNQDIGLLFTPGQRIDLAAVLTTGEGTEVYAKPVWKTSNSAIAAISATANGGAVVTLKKEGSVTITALSNDKMKAERSIQLTVYDYTPTSSRPITVNRQSDLNQETNQYTSNRFSLSLNGNISSAEVTSAVIDTILLGKRLCASSLMKLERSGSDWRVRGDKSLETGTYTVTAFITVEDFGETLFGITGTNVLTVPMTFTVKVESRSASSLISAANPRVNVFYTNASAPILFTTHETVTSVAIADKTTDAFKSNFTVEQQGDGLWYVRRTENDFITSGTTGYLNIQLENYSEPVELKIIVTTNNSPPKLLAKQVSSDAYNKIAIYTLYNETAKEPLTDFMADIYGVSPQFELLQNGDELEFVEKSANAVKVGIAYTVNLMLRKDGWAAPHKIPIKVTVNK